MYKYFKFVFAISLLTFVVGNTLAQAPYITYSPSTNSYPLNTAISSLTPTVVGTVPATTFSTVSTFATAATAIQNPRGLSADGLGNVYEADFTGNQIYKINSAGTATVIAGAGGAGAELDAATNGALAKFNGPTGVVYDGSSYLYVCDYTGGTIRRITLSGSYPVTTIVTGLNKPIGIDYDGTAFLYITDSGNNLIKRISTTSPYTVTVIAGSSSGETNNTTGTSAQFKTPAGIVYTSSNLYVCDNTGHTVRKISLTAPYAVSTVAGTGTAGAVNSPGTPSFNSPYGIAVDASGNLYVADEGNNLIRMITSAGVVSTLAGTGAQAEFDAVGTLAKFYSPYCIEADKSGNLFVGDNNGTSSTCRQILLTGYTISATLPTGLNFAVTTGIITGTPTVAQTATTYTITAYNASGSGSTTVTIGTYPNTPVISYNPSSNNYAKSTTITTLSPISSGGAVGSIGYGTGTLIASSVSGADAVAIDNSGYIYVTVYATGKINKYSSTGTFISTFGTGITMSSPASIVFDSSNNCYVLDKTNQAVYKFSSGGVYQSTIISGLGTNCYGLAIDASNFIYLADYGNNTVKKYNTSGTVQAVSITSGLSSPSGVAVDPSGNIYVLNYSSGKVAKYSSTGSSINTNFISGLNGPWAFSIDGGGNIYIGDSGNSAVRVYSPTGSLLTSITGLNQPDGLISDASGNLWVTDYGNNTLYKYVPTGGYAINADLPSGLTFDISTGNISGTTSTTSFPVTSYTITAYNAAGSGNCTVNIGVANSTYVWVGNADQYWATPGNWSPSGPPGSTDIASINYTNPISQIPVIKTGTTATVGSVIMGGASSIAPGITATGALTVNGPITYQSSSVSANNTPSLIAQLSGTGSITATGLYSNANTGIVNAYSEAITTSVNVLNINGNVSLASTVFSGTIHNASLTITGGNVLVTGVIQTANGTGTTSTLAIVPTTTATLKLSNANALWGLSSTGTNALTFTNTGATVEYSGTAQNVYTSAAITGLSSGVSYQNIKFSGTGIKTAGYGNLNVAGDFIDSLTTINSTNYVDLSRPAVLFSGTTQNLKGGPGNGTTFYNTTFSGAGTKTMISGSFAIANTGVLTMSGTNTATILSISGGSLTLNSDTLGTATVAAISNTATLPTASNGPSITGNVTVQRFVAGGTLYANGRFAYRGYRLMTSPVNMGKDGGNNYPYSLNYLAASTIVSGSISSLGTVGGNPSLYLYNEGNTPSNAGFTAGNFLGIKDISNTVAGGHLTLSDGSTTYKVYQGDGFMMYFRGDKTTHLSLKQTAPYVTPESVTFSTTGTLNQGTISVVSYTGYGGLLYTNSNPLNSTVRGFNLVGNPYPSSIDWSQFSNSTTTAPIYGASVNPTIWIFDSITNTYDTYNATTGIASGTATNIIPSGQGFFVQSNNHSSALTFRETAKVTEQVLGSKSLLGTPASQADYQSYVRLKLIMDTVNHDDIVIGFRGASTTVFNQTEDAQFMPGTAPENLASITSDNKKATVKWLPFPKNTDKQVVKLYASATASGLFTIKMSEVKTVPEIYDIWLMDNYKKDSLDIRHNPTYAFNIDLADTNSFGSNRFTVVVRQNPALGLHLLQFAAAKATGGSQITWKTENEENYTNFTVERSLDKGKTFDVVGGFSSNALGTYTLLDKTPQPGTDEYRLKLEDLNGAITYSDVVTLMYSNSGNTIALNNILVYPNPSNGPITLSIAKAGTQPVAATSTVYGIKIVNSTGSIIKSTTTTQTSWQTDLSNLLPGTYFIQVVKDSDKSLVGKSTFVKL